MKRHEQGSWERFAPRVTRFKIHLHLSTRQELKMTFWRLLGGTVGSVIDTGLRLQTQTTELYPGPGTFPFF